MVTVLLAIDSDRPNQMVFNFAVQFCQRMRAKLDVIRILNPQSAAKRQFNKNVVPQLDFKNRLQDKEQDREAVISYKQSLQADDPDQAIARYVRSHRDVVLTIYDTHRHKSSLLRKQKKLQRRMTYPLVVPLVMARHSSL
jgi:hypothetical protein